MLILQLTNFTGFSSERETSPAVQVAIAIIICVALIIFVKQMYGSFIKNLSQKALEAPTKKLDTRTLRKIASRLGFSKQDITFFETQCKLFGITYVPLISNTEYCIATVFKKIYEGMCFNHEKLSENEVESNKLAIFMLIYKIEHAKRSLSLLTNTIAFSEGLPISYISEDGIHRHSKIIENNKVGLFLEVALDSNGYPVQPPPLSKIQLYFELQGGIAYQVNTRVTRYQSRNGVEEIVVIHSNDVEFFQRRKFRRRDVSLDCNFSAVTVEEDSKTGKKNFTAHAKEYHGKIANISASGCRMTTSIPIRADQYMQITATLPNGHKCMMIGVIVRSRKEINKNVCVLNIRFVRMQKRVQNEIFALVYDYKTVENQTNA